MEKSIALTPKVGGKSVAGLSLHTPDLMRGKYNSSPILLRRVMLN